MSKLPRDVPARRVISALERLGFEVKRVSGSHYILAREGTRVVVPYHSPIKIGTLRSILKSAGLSVEEIIELL